MIASAGGAIARGYDRAHARLLSSPGLALALAAALWLAASAGLARLELDLSFRPLFLSDDPAVERTREFERVFGQSSGAHALVIVERPAAFDEGAARELDAMAAALRHVPGFVEVQGGSRWIAAGREHGRLKWVSADGRMALFAARFAAPMEDLARRRAALVLLEEQARLHRPPGSTLHFTGVSVVEAAYADRVLRDQVVATTLTTAALALLLVMFFGRWRPAAVCLVPVGLAIPATLGLMGWAAAPLTLVNSVIPAVVLVIGVADAIHMVSAWLRERDGRAHLAAVTRAMLAETRRACALTALTSMIGFLSLASARLTVIAQFGCECAAGIGIAYLMNQVLVPWLLMRLRPEPAAHASHANRALSTVLERVTAAALRSPRAVLGVAAISAAACVIGSLGIESDQRFNEELRRGHPVREAQLLLEQEFGGFLGPDIEVRRASGGALGPDAESRVALARAALLRQPGTDSLDVVTAPGGDHLAISLRIGDVGTRRALQYGAQAEHATRAAFGPGYEVAVVGQWWLAQRGMDAILGDMLRSIATSIVTVLPVLALALRGWRLAVVGAVVNVVPMFVPLAFMYAMGIELRIGTAVVVAIALGIAVDDTLHALSRLDALARAGLGARAQVLEMMRTTGRGLVYSNLALMAGFLSMLTNQFQAIRDMGLVAGVTFAGALAVELTLAPALYLALHGRRTEAGAPS